MNSSPLRIELTTNTLDLLVKRSEPPAGVVFQVKREAAREFMGEAIIAAIITIPIGVAVNLFSSWLYDQYRSSKKADSITITINGTKIREITVEVIRDAISTNDHSS